MEIPTELDNETNTISDNDQEPFIIINNIDQNSATGSAGNDKKWCSKQHIEKRHDVIFSNKLLRLFKPEFSPSGDNQTRDDSPSIILKPSKLDKTLLKEAIKADKQLFTGVSASHIDGDVISDSSGSGLASDAVRDYNQYEMQINCTCRIQDVPEKDKQEIKTNYEGVNNENVSEQQQQQPTKIVTLKPPKDSDRPETTKTTKTTTKQSNGRNNTRKNNKTPIENPKNNIKKYFHNKNNIKLEKDNNKIQEDGYSKPAIRPDKNSKVPVTNPGKNVFTQLNSSNKSDLTEEKAINNNQLSIGARDQTKPRPGINMNEH